MVKSKLKSFKYKNLLNKNTGRMEFTASKSETLGALVSTLLNSFKNELLGDPNYGNNLRSLLLSQYSYTYEVLVKESLCELINSHFNTSLMENDIDLVYENGSDTLKISFILNDEPMSIEYNISEEE